MEPEDSLPCSQVPANGPYLKPDETIWSASLRPIRYYVAESKIIRNVGTCFAFGYTAGWAW